MLQSVGAAYVHICELTNDFLKLMSEIRRMDWIGA